MRRAVALLIFAGCAAAGCGDTAQTGGPDDGPMSAASLAASGVPSSAQVTAAPASTPSITPVGPVARYVFPVSPVEGASYAQVHHDYPATDISAVCGAAVLGPTSGVVDEVSLVDIWSPDTDDPAVRGGLSVSVVGDDGVRYYSSHLLDVAPGLEAGSRVAAGDVIGHVGDTGNAAATGCHLHLGISPPCGPGDWSVRRGTVYPWPYLDAWRAGRQDSPAGEVAGWLAAHGDQCTSPAAGP